VLIVYTPHITPRIAYIVHFLLGTDVLLTSDTSVCTNGEHLLINYSATSISTQEYQLIPEGLLTETGIRIQAPTVGQWQDMPVLFPTTEGSIPFDLFSAAFYLLTRYEEYTDKHTDELGRYDVLRSNAYQHNFLHRPLIDEWCMAFYHVTGIKPAWLLAGTMLKPQYDIDVAYRYRGQSPFRNILGFYKDLLTGEFNAIGERSKVYAGKAKDPYDVYDWLHSLHRQYALDPIYFFLVAEKRKRPDLNIDPYTKEMRSLIQQQANLYDIGLHPSVQSSANELLLEREMQLLAYHTGKPIIRSRQHFLQMKLPQTYRQLIQIGIEEDHSMGYGAMNGFRASTCRSFYWYDLLAEKETALRVFPFCYMDSTAIFHERLNADMALARMESLLEKVKAVQGDFRFVMHNHFLADQPEWQVWQQVYEQFLQRNA
jgi:hypothetical protein